MGFFSYLLGIGEDGASRLSDVQYLLSKDDIERLVSRVEIQHLDAQEEKIVEDALVKRRLSNHKISLRQIDDTLRQLKHQGKISDYDRKALVQVFENHFQNNVT